jgi:hypothetical protein
VDKDAAKSIHLYWEKRKQIAPHPYILLAFYFKMDIIPELKNIIVKNLVENVVARPLS